MVDFVFYNIGWPNERMAECFIKSIRNHMPDARITQLSDMYTQEVEGVDRVRRAPSPFPLERNFLHYNAYSYLANLDLETCIFTDMDMLYGGNVEDVLADDFDVALCRRGRNDGMKGRVRRRWPYCSAMFVKTSQFWKDCYKTMLELKNREWANNMEAVALVVNSGKYRVKFLDPQVYNYLPRGLSSFYPTVKIYHFKSRRVDNRHLWMDTFYDKHMQKVIND